MAAWVFGALQCPTLLSEIKKTKLEIYTSPPGINTCWARVALLNEFINVVSYFSYLIRLM